MKELLRTNDLVRLSWVTALLADQGIDAVVLDAYASSAEGSIGALPRRLMVPDDKLEPARRILAESDASNDHG